MKRCLTILVGISLNEWQSWVFFSHVNWSFVDLVLKKCLYRPFVWWIVHSFIHLYNQGLNWSQTQVDRCSVYCWSVSQLFGSLFQSNCLPFCWVVGVLYILDAKSFMYVRFENIFLYSVGCLFVCLTILFDAQKLSVLLKSSLHVLFFCCFCFSVIS